MCKRLYIAANISLWLCNSNFQPKNCHLTNDNFTKIQNTTVFVETLNVTELFNVTANITELFNTTANVTKLFNTTESLNVTKANVTNGTLPQSPSPKPQSPSPRPFSVTLGASVHKNQTTQTNQTNTTQKTQTLSPKNDLIVLHALWSLIPIFAVVAYIMRKRGVKVGYWKKPIRSKSWPMTDIAKTNSSFRSRSTPGTKTEFDSIYTIEV